MKQYKKIPMLLRYAINLVLFAAFLAVGSLLIKDGTISKYFSKVLMLIGINIILAVSLNISTGYLGQLPLGHAGFMAVGAYTSAIFMIKVTHLGMPAAAAFPIGLLLGGIVAGLFGILIGIPALRLKGDYLAIITLGFGEIIRVVLLNIDSVLGFKLTYGAASLKNIPKTTTFFTAFLCVGIVCFLIHTMMKSRHGRAILSIRENENRGGRLRRTRYVLQGARFCGQRVLRGRRGFALRGLPRHSEPLELRVHEVYRNPRDGRARRHGFHGRLRAFGNGAHSRAGTPQGVLGIPDDRVFAAAHRGHDLQALRLNGSVRLLPLAPAGKTPELETRAKEILQEGG